MANKSIAPWIAAGLITGASNRRRRQKDLKIQEEMLKLDERELQLKERKALLDERAQILANTKATSQVYGIDDAFAKGEKLQEGAIKGGVHRIAQMQAPYAGVHFEDEQGKAQLGPRMLQGPGITQALGNLKKAEPVDPRDEKMKDLALQQAQLNYDKTKRDFDRKDMTPEEKKRADRFPDDPTKSTLYYPLLAAVKDVSNAGVSPGQADVGQIVFQVVEEKLKSMEGTIRPEEVAEAAQYLMDHPEVFGTVFPGRKKFLRDEQVGYVPPGQPQAPPAQPQPRAADDWVAQRFPQE